MIAEKESLAQSSKTAHRLYCSGLAYEGHKRFWSDQLQDMEPFCFRQKNIHGIAETAKQEQTFFSLETELATNIYERVGGNNTGVFVCLLTAWSILLKKYSGQRRVLIDTPLYKPALQGEIYEPVVPLVFAEDGQEETRQLLSRVKAQVKEAYGFQNYPLHLTRDTDLPGTNVCCWCNGLHLQPINIGQYDLVFEAIITERAIGIRLYYNPGYFDPGFIAGITGHMHKLLEALTGPSLPVAQISLLTEIERQQLLVDFNQTGRQYTEASFIDLFETQVKKTPQVPALVFENKTWTYEALEERADTFAAYLSRVYELGPGRVVALYAAHSDLLIVGLLAILKTGSAFLPIDSNTPEERVAFMVEDAGAVLVLTGKDMGEEQKAILENKASIAALSVIGALEPERFTGRPARINTAAYVIYTSGSTGNPKGVVVRQDNLSNYLQWANDYYFDNSPGKHFALFTSIAFDLTLTCICTTLLRGDCLFVYHERWPVPDLMAELFVHNTAVNTLKLTPAHISMLGYLPVTHTHIQQVITGGDVLTANQVAILRRLNPRMRIYNEYGPTEATVGCMVKEVQSEDDLLTIGKPIANTRIYILDPEQNLLPVGVFGEICIGGKGVANGYLNRPDLTAEKFIGDTFTPDPGERLYRSGDYGCWTATGEIIFTGRKDNQVKIRGYRIELGEIEKAIRLHPVVREAAAMAISGPDGDKTLVAYYTGTQPLSPELLKAFLQEKLVFYMVPAKLIPLDTFPLTLNGKIDGKALQVLGGRATAQVYTAPETATEQVLVAAFEKILGRERISVTDDFFTIGGDSIKAIQVTAHLYKSGLKLELSALLQQATARRIAPLVTPLLQPADQDAVQGMVHLTPIQHHFFATPRIAYHHFNFGFLFYYRPGFSLEMIRQVIGKLQEHHDVLRMTYDSEGGNIIQYNHNVDYPVHVTVYDFSALQQAKQHMEQAVNALQGAIDLAKGPLLKVALFHLPDGDRLAFLLHHLVSDTVSFRIFFEDMGTLMRQYEQGLPLALPLKTDSFQKWSQHLQVYANGPVLMDERTYWQRLCDHRVNAVIPVDVPEGAQKVRNRAVQRISLSEAETRSLLSGIHEAFHTKINDVLLAALAIALKTLYGFREFKIMMEGHGREELFKDLNISRTAGYFTIAYPLLLSAYGKDTAAVLLENKERIRQIPVNGIGYGILKYLTDKDQTIDFTTEQHPQLLFNYFGQIDEDLEHVEFSMANESVGHIQDPEEQREFELACTSIIAGKVFTLSLEYSSERFHEASIHIILERYKAALLAIIAQCSSFKVMSTFNL